jgi:CPA2 family monovalent cation:H+ antiporter-2
VTDRLLFEILVIVGAAFAIVAVLVRLRFPALVGYLLAGVAIGPHGLALLPETEGVRFLGELGVALLMFIVGLEFSLGRIWAARSTVFGAGALQVGLTALAVAVPARMAGLEWSAGLLLGGALAMSSTAIALKQLGEQHELGSAHGRLATGVLLFQDLATLPLLVWTAARAGGADAAAGEALARAALALALFIAIAGLARRSLSGFIEAVVRTQSAELFLLAVLLLVLSGAYGAHAAGLSLPIGAFLVGMVLGESDFRHAVEDEIRPFRDVLLGLFYITVGMQVDPAAIAAAPVAGALGVLLLVGVKLAVVLVVARLRGCSLQVGFRAGLVLAHAGEFALLLITQSLAGGLLPAGIGQLALTCVVLSMLIAPLLILYSGRLARLLGARGGADPAGEAAAVAEASEDLTDHVILCGCGRVGRLVAEVLAANAIPYLAVERDIDRLRRARDEGRRVVLGDATRPAILHAAGVARARVVVTLLDDRRGLLRLLHHVRQGAGLSVPVIVSAADDVDLDPLVAAGASHVFPENRAAGLALAGQVLSTLGVSPADVQQRIAAARTASTGD